MSSASWTDDQDEQAMRWRREQRSHIQSLISGELPKWIYYARGETSGPDVCNRWVQSARRRLIVARTATTITFDMSRNEYAHCYTDSEYGPIWEGLELNPTEKRFKRLVIVGRDGLIRPYPEFSSIDGLGSYSEEAPEWNAPWKSLDQLHVDQYQQWIDDQPDIDRARRLADRYVGAVREHREKLAAHGVCRPIDGGRP